MPKHDQETSDRFLLAHVTCGSTLCSDGSVRYARVSCDHSRFEFGPTNRIEAVWSSLKRFIRRTHHHVWKEHPPSLLREFEARWNTPELFRSPLTFLEASLTAVPTRY
ncbi:transposase [Candidatus Uhrbacteria bacterium]|nr:transposase [Candidatus Uhrbacteria bacterium]